MAAHGAGTEEVARIQRQTETDGLIAFHRWRYEHFSAPSRVGTTSAVRRAFLCAAIGDSECALTNIEQAVEARDPIIPFIAVSPTFAQLGGDVRFQAILADMGVGAGE